MLQLNKKVSKCTLIHLMTFHIDWTATLALWSCFLAGPWEHVAARLLADSQDWTNLRGSKSYSGGPQRDTNVSEEIV